MNPLQQESSYELIEDHKDYLCGKISDNVCAAFFRVAQKYPEVLAWSEDGINRSYAELDAKVQEWQASLQSLRVGLGDRVLIQTSSAWECVSCMLACLAEGVVYVVLPAEVLSEYIHWMIQDVRPAAVVSDVERNPFKNIIRLQPTLGARLVTRKFANHDIAYIAYTSGTTGRPKGVIHTHANILNEVQVHQQTLRITERDAFSGLYHLSTVGSVRDVFAALLSSAVYCPFVVQQHSWNDLSQYLSDQRITRLHMVPPLFRLWVQSVGKSAFFPDVQTVFLAGDTVNTDDVNQVFAHFPNARFYTGLGASETSSLYVHRLIDRNQYSKEPHLASGKPIPNIEVELQNEYPSKNGLITGEIVVKGHHLSVGYWNNPEQTKQRFTFHEDGLISYRTGDLGYWNEQGELCHMGRKDRQIKLNGIRIEPSGIEEALKSIHGVHHAIVGVRKVNRHSTLVAWLEGEQANQDSQLRETLQQHFPVSHLPRVFIWLKQFPLNRNGKIDYSRLPDPECASQSLDTSDTGDKLEQLFRSLLPAGTCNPDEDFRSLSGDSMGLVQLATEIQTQWGVSLPAGFWRQTVSIHSIRQQLLRHCQVPSEQSHWPVELFSLISQWSLPDSAVIADFPGYKIAGDPNQPLLIWLSQTSPEYLLPAKIAWAGERWVLGSPYPILPTDYEALSRWLTNAIRPLVDQTQGRPVIVGGYCGSGSVAILLATLLQEQGVKVQSALLFEAFGNLPAARRFFYGYATWLNSLQQLRNTSVRQWGTLVLRKWQRFLNQRVGWKKNHAQPGKSDSKIRKRYPFGLKQVPYLDSPIYLVVSNHTRMFRFLYPCMGWSRRQRCTIRIHKVRGNHFSMMSQNSPETLFAPILIDSKT